MLRWLEELDALELDVEEEGPSYLSDLNKVPDFVDEPPVEVPEVRYSPVSNENVLLICFLRHRSRRKQSRHRHRYASGLLTSTYHIFVPLSDVQSMGSKQCTINPEHHVVVCTLHTHQRVQGVCKAPHRESRLV